MGPADELPEPTHPPTIHVVALYREHLATGNFLAK